MLESLKCLSYVTFHSADQCLFDIIPLELDSNILFCVKIDLERILFLHYFDQMINIFPPLVCNTKIVHDQGKRYVPGDVFE